MTAIPIPYSFLINRDIKSVTSAWDWLAVSNRNPFKLAQEKGDYFNFIELIKSWIYHQECLFCKFHSSSKSLSLCISWFKSWRNRMWLELMGPIYCRWEGPLWQSQLPCSRQGRDHTGGEAQQWTWLTALLWGGTSAGLFAFFCLLLGNLRG